jgi:TrmH family RNA methyltransferase
MLSKNKIKLIQSLNLKKNRDELGVFLVEGNKMVEEAIRSGFEIEFLACTSGFADLHPEISNRAKEWVETDSETISKASLLQNPQDALAIVVQQKNNTPEINPENELCLALDFIQDPGNLGTILRIADWYGINQVICSENTVDVFNPKVVQASMGSIFRVKIGITELSGFIKNAVEKGIPVYGTFLEGKNIYQQTLTSNGIIVLGNEGNGISEPISRLVTKKLFIPCFSNHENKPESLNVAIAAAICCSEFRRR